MHRLMAGVTILEHELSELRLLVERQTGILLDCPNSALAAHVAEYLETQNWISRRVAEPSARLRSGSLVLPISRRLLNVNTGFFRHPGAMNALARHVIPQLYARKVRRRSLHAAHLERRLRHRRRSVFDRHGAVRRAAQRERSTARPTAQQRLTGTAGKDAKGKARRARNGGIAENVGAVDRAGERKTGRFTLSAAICCPPRSKSPSADCIRSRR